MREEKAERWEHTSRSLSSRRVCEVYVGHKGSIKIIPVVLMLIISTFSEMLHCTNR